MKKGLFCFLAITSVISAFWVCIR